MRHRIIVAVLLATLVFLTPTAFAGSVKFEFKKIVDNNAAIPDGLGNFNAIGTPVIDNGQVAFQGWRGQNAGSPYESGIYLWKNGTTSKVVDLNDWMPDRPAGDPRKFQIIENPRLSNGEVTFYGINKGWWQHPAEFGLYTTQGGTLRKVVNMRDTIPGTNRTVSNFHRPASIDGGKIAVGLSNPTDPAYGGIFTEWNGTLTKIADTNTLIPGTSEKFASVFHGSFPAEISGNNVAFRGEDAAGDTGIYLSKNGTLGTVVDTGTTVPGSTSTFGGFGQVSLDGENVAFVAGSGNVGGVYAMVNGTLTKVADTTTGVPDGLGNFRSLGNLNISGENVAFWGLGPVTVGSVGVYTNMGGSLTTVIDSFDTLGGKGVDYAKIFTGGFDGNQFAMAISLSDGTGGIYVANAIEVESATAAAAAGLNQEVDVTSATGDFFEDLKLTFQQVQTAGSVTVEQSVASAGAEFAETDAGHGSFSFTAAGNDVQVWDIAFDGTFTDDVILELGYDESLLGPGFDERTLGIYHYENGAWSLLPTLSIDTLNNIIRVKTSSFSPFAVGLDPNANVVVPLPSAAWAGLCLLGALGIVRARRKRAGF